MCVCVCIYIFIYINIYIYIYICIYYCDLFRCVARDVIVCHKEKPECWSPMYSKVHKTLFLCRLWLCFVYMFVIVFMFLFYVFMFCFYVLLCVYVLF